LQKTQKRAPTYSAGEQGVMFLEHRMGMEVNSIEELKSAMNSDVDEIISYDSNVVS